MTLGRDPAAIRGYARPLPPALSRDGSLTAQSVETNYDAGRGRSFPRYSVPVLAAAYRFPTVHTSATAGDG
ncbi:hypothetical protein D3C71_1856060 [compost metagenome]